MDPDHAPERTAPRSPTAGSSGIANPVEVVYLLMCRHNKWPTWAEVDRELDDLGYPDPWQTMRQVDPTHVSGISAHNVPSSSQPVSLTVPGLLTVPNAQEDVEMYVASVTAAARLAQQAPPEQNAVLRSVDLPHLLQLPAAGRADVVAHVGLIWSTEGLFVNFVFATDATDVPRDWQAFVDLVKTRPYRGVSSGEEYLTVRAREAARAARGPGLIFHAESGLAYEWFPDHKLGQGAFGAVYEALGPNGELLVVKWVALDAATTRERDKREGRALREPTVLERLAAEDLKHVIKLVDRGNDPDQGLALVFPRATRSLTADIERMGGRLREDEVWDLAEQLADGLFELHSRRILHRDIKPSNALLLDARWVWADVGLARDLELSTGRWTHHGYGTPEYCAPELFNGMPATESTDLYALGCTLYEALFGYPPCDAERDPTTPDQRFTAHDLTEVSDPTLRRLLGALLANYPTSRPNSAADVLRDIRSRHDPEVDAPLANRLRDIGERAAVRDVARAEAVSAAEQLASRKAQAQEMFASMWRELLSTAERFAPAMTEGVDGYIYWVSVADRRLTVKLAEPSGAAGETERALLYGRVCVGVQNGTGNHGVANLVALDDEPPRWRLLRMDQATSMGGTVFQVEQSMADGRGAIGFTDLEKHLNERQIGLQPVLVEEAPASAIALLELFLTEVEAIDAQPADGRRQF